MLFNFIPKILCLCHFNTMLDEAFCLFRNRLLETKQQQESFSGLYQQLMEWISDSEMKVSQYSCLISDIEVNQQQLTSVQVSNLLFHSESCQIYSFYFNHCLPNTQMLTRPVNFVIYASVSWLSVSQSDTIRYDFRFHCSLQSDDNL